MSSTSRFQCHAWGLNSEVYVGCNEGELYRFDIGSGVGEMLPDSTGTEPVSAVAVSKHHLIAASEVCSAQGLPDPTLPSGSELLHRLAASGRDGGHGRRPAAA